MMKRAETRSRKRIQNDVNKIRENKINFKQTISDHV